MRLDPFYIDGSPSLQYRLENLEAALAVQGMQAEIRLIQLDDNAESARTPGHS